MRVFCILEVLFIFGVLEKIQEYGRPCVGESVVMGDDEGVQTLSTLDRQVSASLVEPFPHEDYTRPANVNHINTYTMGLCVSTTSRLRSTKRFGQGAISGHLQSTNGIDQVAVVDEPQRQR